MKNSFIRSRSTIIATVSFLLATCGVSSAMATQLKGRVQWGGTEQIEPQAQVRVRLFEATESAPILVGEATTNRSGRFQIKTKKTRTSSIFFATARLGFGLEYVAILGPELPKKNTTINELTTVAASYSMAQFYRKGYISGNSFGLRIAAAMNDNIVTTATGASSPVLLASPNADESHSLRMTRSLSNLLEVCAEHPFLRFLFLHLTKPAGGSLPPNTAVALANLARDPGQQVGLLYLLSRFGRSYSPVLAHKPDAWTITVKVNDSGDDRFLFGGPANVAFDSLGYAWIANNTVQGTPNSAERIMVLKPNGKPADGGPGLPTSPIRGGGILGVGWGITVDPLDQVWTGNFGWGGDAFFPTLTPPGNGSVSKLSFDGTPLSNPNGFYGGTLRVQGIKSDAQGTIWNSSFGNDKAVVFPGGDPRQAKEYFFYPGAGPFGMAIDSHGDAWVTCSGGLSGSTQSSVAKLRFDQNGEIVLLFAQDVGSTLKVIDVDSQGNAWLASQGDNQIYGFKPNGEAIGSFSGGGINGPWGLCIDGEDNIWVANFGPLELDNNFTNGGISKLAGVNRATRPPGKSIGDPLSPDTGYTVQSAGSEVLLSDGTPLYGTGPGAETSFAPIMRQTSVQIDQAGNIWSVNNWKPRFTTDIGLFDDGTIVVAPDEANPGGDGIIIYVGLASPPTNRVGM